MQNVITHRTIDRILKEVTNIVSGRLQEAIKDAVENPESDFINDPATMTIDELVQNTTRIYLTTARNLIDKMLKEPLT